MLRVEITESKTNQRSFVSFFDDDTIDTVRQQIGRTLDIHPDRLYILAHIERPADYYKRNPQRWEALFNRLSLTEKFIQRVPFSEYQTFYRSPASSILYGEIDSSDWMEVPEAVKELHSPSEPFSEYMIFGVKEDLSFILPRNYDSVVSKIPSAQFPIPDTSALISTLYDPADIKGFYCIPYEPEAEPVQSIYFPLMRPPTPSRLSEEEIGLLKQNEVRIRDLLALKSPEPTDVAILRTRFHVPWIETDFGSAIRTRFEQMFYGLTVSEEVPCITLFTGVSEVSRHKFYAKNPKKKEPFVDMGMWNAWWNTTKPSRNRPTLILYRGTSNQHFDRIAITSTDMIVSTYRPETSKDTLEDLTSTMSKWITHLDSILPFVNPNDLDKTRWDLQDMSFLAKYSKRLEEYDLRRFSCVSSIFDIADAEKSLFRFLRTDYSVQGVSALEMKVLQLMRQNPSLRVADIATELSISTEKARVLFQQIETRKEEDPEILNKAFRGFPTMRLGPNTVLLSSTNRLEKSLQYANILRYLLTSPDADDIDKVCPKRMERVEATAIHVDEEKVDQAILDEFADFGELVEDAPKEEHIESVEEPAKFLVKSDRKTLYNYFNARLQKFDPETYNTNHANYKYPKKCEQKHQPIILNDTDLSRLKGTPYDPREYMEETQQMNVEDPMGLVICPEFWCIRDEIPLREDQLLHDSGVLKCPMCKGKVKDTGTQNPQEYTVIKRDSIFKYPGMTKYKSPTNNRLMPCCYRTPETKQTKPGQEDKYYILGETKTLVPDFRTSFISRDILASLGLKETYELFAQPRLQPATSGYFRVGIGRPSNTLAKLLGLDTKIPEPRYAVQTVLKCSFFHTWTSFQYEEYEDFDDIYDELESYELAYRVAGIDYAYQNGDLSVLQELEYVALCLQCDVFRIMSSSKSLSCFFRSKNMISKRRGLLVFQDGDTFTALSYVRRVGNRLDFSSNIYEKPFPVETHKYLEDLRDKACITKVPSLDTALKVMGELGIETFSVILDPYLRGQAIYVPSRIILPFQATPLPALDQPTVSGFENAKELPTHADVLTYLDVAKKYADGFAWEEDLYNAKNERVEVRLKSGLRIPVVPEIVRKAPTEVIESVNTIGERKMTFEDKDRTLEKSYRELSYASEIFDFLIFEMSKTLEDVPDLREQLRSSPTRVTLEPVLREWFDNVTMFVDVTKPIELLSKIRTPCGQFKSTSTCSGSVCGWKDGMCKIKVNSAVRKDAIFHRLLSTLVENAKTRAIVLDGRATPFFSTILYIELPHELILTDIDIKA